MNRVALLLLISFTSPIWADYPVELIELKGRPAVEIIPLIQPFVIKGGAVTGMDNNLVLRTSPENLREIRRILRKLDQPPRQLVIHVRQDSGSQGAAGGVAVDLDAQLGSNTQVTVGHPDEKNSIQIQGSSQHTRSNLDSTHRVRTLEGQPAFIATRMSIPISDYYVYGGPLIPRYQSNTRFRDVTTGFYATAHVNGERVTLDIMPHLERPGAIDGTFDIQRARTRVTGKLGEWISLGGVDQHTNARSRGIGYQVGTRNQRERDISLLVLEIP